MDSSQSLTSVSTENSSQSVGNNPLDQLLSSQGGGTSSSMHMTCSSDSEPHQEEKDMLDVKAKCLTKSLTGKGKEKVDDTTIDREGKAEDIGLLMDLHELHNKTGQYALLGGNEERDFYKFWIEEEGEFGNREELDNKINELHARFLKNMDKNVEGPTDHIDVEILRLSHWIWGNEIDSCKEEEADDGVQDSKDSSDDKGGNDDDHGGVNSKDLSHKETGEPGHGVVTTDTKDSTVEDSKDLSSKENEDESPAS